MAKIYGPRKCRTRQHVIADQSVHHVEGFILDAGHTAERFGRDYGYDLLMTTYDRHGYIEPDGVYFQIKASDRLHEIEGAYVHDLDIRDYNLWIRESWVVVLVLYDARSRSAYWIVLRRYFQEDASRRPKRGAKWVRIRVPKVQILGRAAIDEMRHLKRQNAIA